MNFIPMQTKGKTLPAIITNDTDTKYADIYKET